jgi:hypothetical protein
MSPRGEPGLILLKRENVIPSSILNHIYEDYGKNLFGMIISEGYIDV